MLWGLTALLLGTQLSCGLGTLSRKMVGRKVHVQIVSTEHANLDNPVALDIVLVFREELEKQLLEYSAAEWMRKKNQFKLDYIEDEDYLLWELEPVPGLTVPDVELPLTVTGNAFVVFADYYTPGEHRVRTDPQHSFRILLQERGFVLEPLDR
jgi:hypothetical protein